MRHGFAGYHFNIGEVAVLGADEALALAARKGVRLSAWGFPVDYRGEEAAYQASLAQLPELAKVAAALGVRRTATWLMPTSDELTYQEKLLLSTSSGCGRPRQCSPMKVWRLGLEYVAPKTLWSSKRYEFVHTMAHNGGIVPSRGRECGLSTR